MSKNKENVPKIRFPGFTNAWEQRKLGDVLKYEQPTKYIVESTDYDDSFSIPVLTAGQSFILGYTNEINGIKEADRNNPVIIFDDFTTSSHYVDFPFKIKSSAMKILTLKEEDIDFYFVYNTLKNIKYIPQSHERHWISKFSEFKILVPLIDEQKKIGSFFKNIDHLITLHQRKLNNIQNLKAGLLQKMFPKKDESFPEIRFPGFTNAWEQRKLGDVAQYFNGGSFENDVQEKGKYELVTLKSVDMNGNLVSSGRYVNIETSTLVKGTLVMILSEQSPGLLGMTAQIPMNNKYVLNQRVAEIRPNQGVDSYFLSMIINKNQQYFSKHGAGTKVQNISKPNVENYKFSCPAFHEQQKIGTFFQQLDNLITLHQRKLEHLQEQKKALLQQMFV